MKQKKLRTKLAKKIRKTYGLDFIESVTVAKAFLSENLKKLDFEIYDDEYETVYYAKNETIPFRAVQQMIEAIEKEQFQKRHKQYQCFICRKHYQSKKKATKCCTHLTENEEDDEWEAPRKLIARKPVASTHTCPNVKHGGKSWSVWLSRGETCPMCQYTYLPC